LDYSLQPLLLSEHVGALYFLSYNGDKGSIHNNFLMDFDKSSKNFVFSMVAQLFLLIQMITVYVNLGVGCFYPFC
jgi:hypothetical protein